MKKFTMSSVRCGLMNASSIPNYGEKNSKTNAFMKEVYDHFFTTGRDAIHSFTDDANKLTVEVTDHYGTVTVRTYRKGKLVADEQIERFDIRLKSGNTVSYLKSYLTKGSAKKSIFSIVPKSFVGTVDSYKINDKNQLGFLSVEKNYFWPFKKTDVVKVFDRQGNQIGYEYRIGKYDYTFYFCPEKGYCY